MEARDIVRLSPIDGGLMYDSDPIYDVTWLAYVAAIS